MIKSHAVVIVVMIWRPGEVDREGENHYPSVEVKQQSHSQAKGSLMITCPCDFQVLWKVMATHSSILDWRFHGQRSLVGYNPWSCKDSDITEQLTLKGTHNLIDCASLSTQMVKNLSAKQEAWVQSLGSGRSPGEGHGNTLQYSCLENSKDRGAWWATIHKVAKTQT